MQLLPPARLAATVREEGKQLLVTVTNTGQHIALGVTVTRPDGHWLAGAENYRHLLPGESWTARFTPRPREGYYLFQNDVQNPHRLAVSAWNTPAVPVAWQQPAVV